MKVTKKSRWSLRAHHAPVVAQVLELAIGLVVFSAVSGTLAVLVGADPDTTPPSVPTSVALTGRSAAEIDLSWNVSTDDTGVIGYHVFRNGSQVAAVATTDYADTGLAANNNYVYTISAYDAAGNESAQSALLSATTLSDTSPPSVPTNLHQTGQTTSSITIAWNASSDNVGVTGYHIYRNGSLIASPGGNDYTDSGLGVGSSYTYTISAYDAVGNESAQSAPFYASSSTDTSPPSVALNLQTTNVLDTSISFSWNASSDNVGVAGYKIYREGSLLGTSTTPSYTDSGLIPVTNYSYTVEAYDAANNTAAASQPLTARTAFDTTAPTVPTAVSSPGQTDQTTSLSWSASTDNVGVTGYDVYRNGTLITTTTGTSYTDSGLSVSTAYAYSLRAHDGSGNNSSLSPPVTVSTLSDQVAPTIPGNLASAGQTTTTVDLTWDAASDDVGISGYKIYRDGSFVASVGGTEFSDTSLPYNTSFSYVVSAYDAAGNESAKSVILRVTTLPDTTPPMVNLQTPSPGQNLQLTFPITAAASDDLALAKVEFFVDSTLIGTSTTAPFGLNWNSYAAHNGAHTITAEAFDASGNTASQSAAIVINNPPPALEGDLNGDHKVNLTDLSILLSHWGKAGAGDFNNNGRVDIFDLSVLLSRYGQDNSNYQ